MSDDGMVLITPARLVRHYRAQLHDYHAEARAYMERRLGKLSCGKGCAFCCYSKVIIDLGEAAVIYLYLKATGQWTEALARKLAETDRAMAPTPHGQWLEQRRPCVFLKETSFGHGACSVYPVRPFSCASAFSEREPETCAVVGGEFRGFHSAKASEFFGRLHLSIMAGLGLDEAWAGTIPGAVLHAQALIEGLPPPTDAFRVELEKMARDGRTDGEYFDEQAGKWRQQP
jgi:Fe-S-cluster containining protein